MLMETSNCLSIFCSYVSDFENPVLTFLPFWKLCSWLRLFKFLFTSFWLLKIVFSSFWLRILFVYFLSFKVSVHVFLTFWKHYLHFLTFYKFLLTCFWLSFFSSFWTYFSLEIIFHVNHIKKVRHRKCIFWVKCQSIFAAFDYTRSRWSLH